MTTNEITKLDKLFQIKVLELHPHSVIAGNATVAHHFIHKAKGLSMRWYLPNGVSLTNSQHGDIHGAKRAELEKMIIRKLGNTWRDDLRIQERKIVKNLKYQSVLNHLMGLSENYV